MAHFPESTSATPLHRDESLPLAQPAEPRAAAAGEHLDVLAIIPARGGSKGLPGKNIMDLCGKPLIAYSIEAARHARHVTRVVVSTDDEAIAEVALRHGAEVPFLRPKELADDTASLRDVVGHVLKEIRRRGHYPDAHVILLPTSPFRTPRLINFATAKLLEGYDEVLTAKPVTFSPSNYFRYSPGAPLAPLFPRCADQPETVMAYKQYGVLHAISDREAGSLGTYVIPLRQESDMPYLIDIDTPEDLRTAQEMILGNLFDFELR